MKLRAPLLLLSFPLLLSAVVQAQVFDKDYVDERANAEVEASLGLHSDRMFRGQNLYNGTSIQPSARVATVVGPGSAYLKLFAHLSGDQGDAKSARGGSFDIPDPDPEAEDPADDMTEDDPAEDDAQDDEADDTALTVAEVTPSFTEFDYAIGYEVDFDLFVLDVAHTWYTYSKTTGRLDDTAEISATMDFNAVAHPYITAAHEYDARNGWYYEGGLRQPIPLGNGGSSDHDNALIPFVKLGISHGLDDGRRPIYDDNGLAFVDVGVSGLFYISDDVRLQPVGSPGTELEFAL